MDKLMLTGCRSLAQSGIVGRYKLFHPKTCYLTLSMLNKDMSVTMGVSEVKSSGLCWAAGDNTSSVSMAIGRKQWAPRNCRRAFDNRIQVEPQNCEFHYKATQRQWEDHLWGPPGLLFKSRTLTDSIQSWDPGYHGRLHFSYDDFIQCFITI